MDNIKEPQSAAENDALTEELGKALVEMRGFLDDPVALLERALSILTPRLDDEATRDKLIPELRTSARPGRFSG